MGQDFPAKVWRETKKDLGLLSQEGKLWYWTTVKVAGQGYESLVPYTVAIIRLKNRRLVSGQLVDWQDKQLKKGKKVIGVVRRMRVENQEGLIRYGLKWRLVS